ncbi:hypothetical protein [Cyclobacterium plantarum]|uniref:Uncharacterized protein n=1 Tax=Cyclobacterium plantarum TaxID=2716263 RepID=A0ABX0HH32_9BACT|nr:hypothetical protein [Cyclobacterium plantarum]NHE59431.1 hypothetical protein [Cyclobacterium plantarum]
MSRGESGFEIRGKGGFAGGSLCMSYHGIRLVFHVPISVFLTHVSSGRKNISPSKPFNDLALLPPPMEKVEAIQILKQEDKASCHSTAAHFLKVFVHKGQKIR